MATDDGAPREVEVGDGVSVLVNGQGAHGEANSTVLYDDGDAVVVDTTLLPRMAQAIHETLGRRDLTARLVVNTHQHADHFGGNVTFAGVPMVASTRTVRTMSAAPKDHSFLQTLFPRFADELADFRFAAPGPVGADGVRWAHPLVFDQAHSPGDLALWLPGPKVLVAGDLSFNGVTPMATHGNVAGWIRALDVLTALEPAVVVPGHGPPGSAKQLETVRAYLERLLEVASRALDAGTDPVAQDADPGGWLEPQRTRLNLQIATAELRTAAPRP